MNYWSSYGNILKKKIIVGNAQQREAQVCIDNKYVFLHINIKKNQNLKDYEQIKTRCQYPIHEKKNCPQSNQHIYGGFHHLLSPQYPNIVVDQTLAILQ